MELQSYINETVDYLHKFKEHKLYVRTYAKLNLCIVKCYHNNEYEYDKYPWIKYCRGAVIDTHTNQVICIPPQKGFQRNTLNELIDEYEEDSVYEPLIDGTMVNMFYHKDEWMIATRGNIGGTNSWDGKQSFINMFLEVNGSEWFTTLDKTYCYSFVLHHVNNRNVTPIEQNTLFLIENYERKEGQMIQRPLQEIENINNITHIGDYAFANCDLLDVTINEKKYGLCLDIILEHSKIKPTVFEGNKLETCIIPPP